MKDLDNGVTDVCPSTNKLRLKSSPKARAFRLNRISFLDFSVTWNGLRTDNRFRSHWTGKCCRLNCYFISDLGEVFHRPGSISFGWLPLLLFTVLSSQDSSVGSTLDWYLECQGFKSHRLQLNFQWRKVAGEILSSAP